MLSHSLTPTCAKLSRLRVDTLRTERALVAIEPEWIALERRSGNTLPFRTAAWARSWWSHVREQSLAVNDALAIRTLRDDRGVLVGIAPLMLTTRPAIGPLRTRCLQFIGADPNWTEVRGLLCLPGTERACYEALLDDVTASARDWDWIVWSGVTDGEARAALADRAASGGVRLEGHTPCYVLDLPATWEELRGRLSRNIKESIRKCYNSLKRDGLTFTFEVAMERAEMRAALDDFFRLHSRRAELKGTVWHPDLFRDARGAAFLVDVCERLADAGAARVFRLRIDGRVVATRIGLVANDCLYLYYSGYDPAYARYSVMTTTLVEALKYAIAQRYRSANLGSGKDGSKTRWDPREVSYHHGVQVSQELRGRAAHKAFALASEALHAPGVWRYAQQILARRARDQDDAPR